VPSLCHLPTPVAAAFDRLATPLDRRSTPRFLALLLGALFARGRRTVTAWFRAAGITTDYRPAYTALAAAGRKAEALSTRLLLAVLKPLMAGSDRIHLAIDDSPTKRYGPCVEGADRHHNPTPGPHRAEFLYGHVWVTLAWLAEHPRWGTIAIPLRALLYLRQRTLATLPPWSDVSFRTKLELAADLLGWAVAWLKALGLPIWVVVDGGYAKKPFLAAARALGVVLVGRLRKDAALRTVPPSRRPKGKRGRTPIYGKGRIDLAKRAGQNRGWLRLTCVQYGKAVVKTYQTFVATWRPAGGAIRVVLVRERHGWVAFVCTDPEATAIEVLELAADRGSIEGTFKDLKEVWGAGQQQVRHLDASIGAFHVNVWLYAVVEAWAWARPEGRLVDRRASPWDAEPRRPSHADKRRALQREILVAELRATLGPLAQTKEIQDLIQRLLATGTGM
jgi:hypothetical protein